MKYERVNRISEIGNGESAEVRELGVVLGGTELMFQMSYETFEAQAQTIHRCAKDNRQNRLHLLP